MVAYSENTQTHCCSTTGVQFDGVEAGVEGAVLYSTYVPCLECTKMAITVGIRKFVCLDEYPETDYDLIKEAGVEIEILDSGH